MTTDSAGEIQLEYDLEDRPPWPKTLLLALQHVAVMLVPATAVAFIVAGAVGLSAANTAYIVQMVLVFSGLATVVQAYTVGPVGAKLPVVMGTSFTFVGASASIGASQGLAVVLGSVLVAGYMLVE